MAAVAYGFIVGASDSHLSIQSGGEPWLEFCVTGL
jgi:hypothetical protein